MLKIGEFSKLSHLTIKTLRYYEKEGILCPAFIAPGNGYRFYETSQLTIAAKIKAYRQLGLSIDEIKDLLDGKDVKLIFEHKLKVLQAEKNDIEIRLSIINHILEEEEMKYQVIEKTIPAAIVYYSETVLDKYSDCMKWIPTQGEECRMLNPNLKCVEPPYEFCEYPDGEHKEKNIKIRHNEAVTEIGVENDNIKFRQLQETRVLSIFHRGAYESIGEAYAYIMRYADDNGYKVTGLARESYIDGIWNKESVEEWLTEIQLPIQ